MVTSRLKKNLTIIDLFSGCGGISQGFKNMGYTVLAAIENDEIVATTYKNNHPDVKLYVKDIRKINARGVIKDFGLLQNELTVLSICAPCQPFSRVQRSNKKDDRTQLILASIPFVKALRPKYILVENVPGLAKGKNLKILNSFIKALIKLQYTISGPVILDAVNYGVPQFRKRLFLMASNNGRELAFPKSTHYPPGKTVKTNLTPWLTVRDVFKNLQILNSGEKSAVDKLHCSRNHSEINLERLKYIPKNGGSRSSLPRKLQLRCHTNKKGYNDVYGRMTLDKPANTLTGGCTNFTKGRFAHPIEDRAITPREAARLQTFPDNYVFLGSIDKISNQIGNAVPVRLAEIFANYFYEIEAQE
jgi:DNA (cytosine-5)-methyltransferase 1